MKFTFNWGHGMFLAMAVFVVFIGSFVYKVMVVEKYEHKLVSDQYYKDELHYQEEIDRQNNSGALDNDVQIIKNAQGILILFPQELDYKKIKANLKLQRFSDEDFDIIETLTLDSLSHLIPDEKLISGYYNLKLNWEYNGIEYQTREKINY